MPKKLFSKDYQPARNGNRKGSKHRSVTLREAFKNVALKTVDLEMELQKLLKHHPKDFFRIMASLEPKKMEIGGGEDLLPIQINFLNKKESADD